MNNEKIAADLGCTMLTALGMTQTQSQALFILSLISTIIGILLTFVRNVVIPLYIAKRDKKKLTQEDLQGAVDKTIEAKDDIINAVGDNLKKDK